jgi:hypothetical protein
MESEEVEEEEEDERRTRDEYREKVTINACWWMNRTKQPDGDPWRRAAPSPTSGHEIANDCSKLQRAETGVYSMHFSYLRNAVHPGWGFCGWMGAAKQELPSPAGAAQRIASQGQEKK